MKKSSFKAQVEYYPIDKVIPYPANSKKHPPEQISKLVGMIAEFGWDVPIVIDENGTVLKGHGRLLAAQRMELKEVPVIVRHGLSEAKKKAIRIADNKVAESPWDDEFLKVELEALAEMDFDLNLTGFDEEDWSSFTKDDGTEFQGSQVFGGKESEDEVAGLIEEAESGAIESRVKPGEVWKLGRHYIACGDCTVEENVRKLLKYVGDRKPSMVWADPPYGYSYQSNMRKGQKFDVLENDDTILEGFIPPLLSNTEGWVLVCTTWKVLREWLDATQLLGKMQNLIVWDKGGGGMGDLTHSLSTDYELVLAFNRGATIKGKRIGSVWNIEKDSAGSYVHPTQKPSKLLEVAFDVFSLGSDLIFDPFLGSAPSIIAAQKMEGDRTVVGFELSTDYCEVVCQRYEKLTGQTAILTGTL